jgi:hypothetical protein
MNLEIHGMLLHLRFRVIIYSIAGNLITVLQIVTQQILLGQSFTTLQLIRNIQTGMDVSWNWKIILMSITMEFLI